MMLHKNKGSQIWLPLSNSQEHNSCFLFGNNCSNILSYTASTICASTLRAVAIFCACLYVGSLLHLQLSARLGAVISNSLANSFWVRFISCILNTIISASVGGLIGHTSFSYYSTKTESMSSSIKRGSSTGVSSFVSKKS